MNFYKENPVLQFQLSHSIMEKIVTLKKRNYEDNDKCDYAPEYFEDAIDSYDKNLTVIGEI